MATAELDTLDEGRWYWHDGRDGRRRVQIARRDVTESGITIVTTDEIYERCSYPRGQLVELAPDPLGPDGPARRDTARRELGLN